MVQSTAERPRIDVSVENIGGIAEADVQLPPGVTVLEGENATNRTSFLQAIMAGLGSEKPSLKADADSGRVELRIGEETYTGEFERTGTGVRTNGDPYLDDPTAADTFAFLLEANPARQAVIRRTDLRSVIMEPVDTTAIQAEITQKQARKTQLDERLSELDSLRNERPALTEDLTRIETELAEKRDELESVRSEIEGAEVDLSETRETKEAMESALQEVQQLRAEHASVSDRLEAERESLAAARAEREDVVGELETAPEAGADEREEIEERISALRSEQSRLESTMSELQNLVQFNEDLLEGDAGALAELRESDADVTDQLVGSDSVTCWTCGSVVDRSQIAETVERLRELRADKLDRTSAIDDEIETLSAELDTLDRRRETRRELEAELDALDREIQSRSATIDELEEKRTALEADVEAAEADLESREFASRHDELLELHQRANRLELEIEQLESERAEAESELESIEERLDRQADLEAEREEVTEELTELRTRVERIETEAVEEFNDRIEEILEIMGYSNIARIWIERTEQEGGDESLFQLHVVRSDATGTAYEDTIDHLSESEREVTGLVFALAGYLVHEVAETVPFMLLDSVEALDSDRIARLVEYFEDHVPYLVVALLPEDARALDDRHPRITEI
ncbi:MAG: archaea-specific SMC-related protein [Halodesulfurarchaeum sp.]